MKRDGPKHDGRSMPAKQPLHDTENANFAARLTIDVTPELRGRIKIAAFRRGLTASALLRELLERGISAVEGEQS